ncbi:hypothetical protein [Streptomyces sp.]|uniref:COG1470 family protein n=1 Tax=Streptomyces sp. TaxID=1931 RepID=UPI002D786F79|nr:hypothetical protein [Streptomyces sp.]HET6356525.1 hypothetical protein [Streptomyces sp.]
MLPRLAVTLAALLCALCAPAARAADAAWTVQPGGARPYVYLEGGPGTVLEDTLSVTNPGTKPLTVRLRPADAYNTGTGALGRVVEVAPSARRAGPAASGACSRKAEGRPRTGRTWATPTTPRVCVPGAAGWGYLPGEALGEGLPKHALAVRGARKFHGAGTWITLASERVSVPPRMRAQIPFSVTVPPGALPGDHPGAIMAASGGREAGVRIHLRVSGPTLAAFTVEQVKISGGAIHYTLVNRGNTVLTPRVTIRADGLFGEVLRRAPRTLPVELLPAQRVTLTEKWPGHPTLDSVTVHVEATAPGDARAKGSASVMFVPWAAVAGSAAALLAAAGGTVWFLRRRRPADPGPALEQTGSERHLARSGA